MHRERFTIKPLRLSQQNLLEILKMIHNFIKDPKHVSENCQITETLSVSRSGKTITHEGEPKNSNFFAYPDFIDSVEYNYYSYNQDISRIRIDLSHFERDIIVEGKNKVHVEALAALIKKYFNMYTTWFGGLVGSISMSLFILFMVQIIATLLHYYGFISFYVGLLIFIIGISLPLYLMSSRNWPPGIAIYKGDVSFLEKTHSFNYFY